MLATMKYEIRKYNLIKYAITLAISNTMILGLLIGVNMYLFDQGKQHATTITGLFIEVGSITRELFIILTAVLLVKFIVSEYRQGTVSTLFMYPRKRATLIGNKLIWILILMSSSVLVCTMFNGLISYLVLNQNGLIHEGLTVKAVIDLLLLSVQNVWIAIGLGLVPMFFGIRKKSVVLTMSIAVFFMFIEDGLGIQALSYLAFLGTISILFSFWRLNILDVGK